VRISAKTDYALRALLLLAERAPDLVKLEVLATAEDLPRKFVESILSELRRAGLVQARRGSDGGYGLAVPAEQISIGAVIRVVDGPLAQEPRGRRRTAPAELAASATAGHLHDVWLAMDAGLRLVLDETSLAHVVSGRLPDHVERLAASAAARTSSAGAG
jgi:Rrf2 family protein